MHSIILYYLFIVLKSFYLKIHFIHELHFFWKITMDWSQLFLFKRKSCCYYRIIKRYWTLLCKETCKTWCPYCHFVKNYLNPSKTSRYNIHCITINSFNERLRLGFTNILWFKKIIRRQKLSYKNCWKIWQNWHFGQ